jgi:hypothetical protein
MGERKETSFLYVKKASFTQDKDGRVYHYDEKYFWIMSVSASIILKN